MLCYADGYMVKDAVSVETLLARTLDLMDNEVPDPEQSEYLRGIVEVLADSMVQGTREMFMDEAKAVVLALLRERAAKRVEV